MDNGYREVEESADFLGGLYLYVDGEIVQCARPACTVFGEYRWQIVCGHVAEFRQEGPEGIVPHEAAVQNIGLQYYGGYGGLGVGTYAQAW